MPLAPVTLPVSTSGKINRPFTSRELINMEVVPAADAQSRNKFMLRSTGGLKEWRAIDSGENLPLRGMLQTGAALYAVFGNKLYQMQRAGDNVLNNISKDVDPDLFIPGTAYVSMAYNGVEVCIVADGRGFIYNEASKTLVEISDPQFLSPIDVTFIDGYFVFAQRLGDTLFISALNDGLSYATLDQIKVQRNPDKLIAVESLYNQVMVFGERTVEFFVNTGAANTPFRPRGNSVLEVGCGATHSVVRVPEVGMMWLGHNGLIYLYDGSLRNVLTPDLAEYLADCQLEKDCDLSDAVAWTYSRGAHRYYIITFPSVGKTFVYEVESNSWHERTTYDRIHWRGVLGVRYNDQIIVGDAFDKKLYTLQHDTFTDAGDAIRRTVTFPVLHGDSFNISIHELRLVLETGLGDYADNDTIRLSISRDDGMTFSKIQQKPFATRGQYHNMIKFNGIGDCRNGAVLKLETAANCPINIIAAYANISKGTD